MLLTLGIVYYHYLQVFDVYYNKNSATIEVVHKAQHNSFANKHNITRTGIPVTLELARDADKKYPILGHEISQKI